MTDEAAKRVENEYITPHLRGGESVRVWISSAASTHGYARLLDALGPFAIAAEAFFSRPTIVALTGQRLLFSAVTVLRSEEIVESVELSDLQSAALVPGLVHKHLSIRARDGRRFRVTAAGWSPFKTERDGITHLFEALGLAPQPA